MGADNSVTDPRVAGPHEGSAKPGNTGAEQWLGKPIACLNDGFVRLVDYLGSDEAIVQAARVSYGKGTKKVQDDAALIRYLMRHRHTTPFEMCELKFHVRVPMDAWRQWIRHRTANVNEYSTRYSEAIDSAQRTSPDGWRVQSSANKQGSGGLLSREDGAFLSAEEEVFQRSAREVYERRIALGVAREQARKDLPLSTYTEAYWKIDLHNLFHFLSLRMDSHAQQEIRVYANAMAEIVRDAFPTAYQAFEDYRLNALPLSRLEIEVIRNARWPLAEVEARAAIENLISGKRESEECFAKLVRLGLVAAGDQGGGA
jgi:thymidylate synthase (FAD)